jgi:hypothetical protein
MRGLSSTLVGVGLALPLVGGGSLASHYLGQLFSYGVAESHTKELFWLFLVGYGLFGPAALVLFVACARASGPSRPTVIAALIGGPLSVAPFFGIGAPLGLMLIGVCLARDLSQAQRPMRWLGVAALAGGLVVGVTLAALERQQALGRALIAAVAAGDAAAVDDLLRRGARPNVHDQSGTNALLEAIRRGRADLLARLVTVPVDLVGADDFASPLRVAVESGRADLVRPLVESASYTPMLAGETEQGPPYDGTDSALGLAERMGRQDLVQLLRRPRP